MASGTEEELLQMSLTGTLPPSLQNTFDAEKDKGNIAYREGRYEDALRHYTDAELINPISPIPPANRAMVYLKLSQYQQAKDQAAIAYELHASLPPTKRSSRLAVKILLRRATACKELLLLAMAAEDFQAVLDLEENSVARAELKQLKDRHAITPSHKSGSSQATGAANHRPGIHVVSEDVATLKKTTPGDDVRASITHETVKHSQVAHRHASMEGSDEDVLLQLSKPVMDGLVAKWSAHPPRTASEFERAWKSLVGNEKRQADYLLRIVGSERISQGVLGESVTPQLLEEIIGILTFAVLLDRGDSRAVANMLSALSSVPRFDMLLMFLSSVEKKPISRLLDLLDRNAVGDGQLSTLKQCYKVC